MIKKIQIMLCFKTNRKNTEKNICILNTLLLLKM